MPVVAVGVSALAPPPHATAGSVPAQSEQPQMGIRRPEPLPTAVQEETPGLAAVASDVAMVDIPLCMPVAGAGLVLAQQEAAAVMVPLLPASVDMMTDTHQQQEHLVKSRLAKLLGSGYTFLEMSAAKGRCLLRAVAQMLQHHRLRHPAEKLSAAAEELLALLAHAACQEDPGLVVHRWLWSIFGGGASRTSAQIAAVDRVLEAIQQDDPSGTWVGLSGQDPENAVPLVLAEAMEQHYPRVASEATTTLDLFVCTAEKQQQLADMTVKEREAFKYDACIGEAELRMLLAAIECRVRAISLVYLVSDSFNPSEFPIEGRNSDFLLPDAVLVLSLKGNHWDVMLDHAAAPGSKRRHVQLRPSEMSADLAARVYAKIKEAKITADHPLASKKIAGNSIQILLRNIDGCADLEAEHFASVRKRAVSSGWYSPEEALKMHITPTQVLLSPPGATRQPLHRDRPRGAQAKKISSVLTAVSPNCASPFFLKPDVPLPGEPRYDKKDNLLNRDELLASDEAGCWDLASSYESKVVDQGTTFLFLQDLPHAGPGNLTGKPDEIRIVLFNEISLYARPLKESEIQSFVWMEKEVTYGIESREVAQSVYIHRKDDPIGRFQRSIDRRACVRNLFRWGYVRSYDAKTGEVDWFSSPDALLKFTEHAIDALMEAPKPLSNSAAPPTAATTLTCVPLTGQEGWCRLHRLQRYQARVCQRPR